MPPQTPNQPDTLPIQLREVRAEDLSIFFMHQRDPQANLMAAFTAKDPSDRGAFDAHWAKIMANPAIILRAILWQGQVAGSVLAYPSMDALEVSYWLGREYWGLGIATQALRLLLLEIPARPLVGRVVKDNLASLRVLEKCGFVIMGTDKGFANARNAEVEEYILELK